MKLFKKIPIKGYEEYEFNEDGYVLHTKTGILKHIEYSHMIPDSKSRILPLLHILEHTFKDKEL